MKKIYMIMAGALLSLGSSAQNSIPNGGFESWTSGNYDVPTGYINSNPQTFWMCNSFNSLKFADPYHGSFAVQMTTVGNGSDACMGYIVNSPNPGNGNPCNWPGGFAYSQVPTGIKGYYKNNSVSNDSAGILVGFRNGTNCLGFYMYKFGGVHNTYTPFQFVFNPPISGTPDTMIFAAISSDVFNNIAVPGNMLQLDSISLTGVSQTAGFNGDFELWQNLPIEKPNSWYFDGNDAAISSIIKTTDKQAGTYAVELKTYGSMNKQGVPIARGAQISTGYYPNCNGPCPMKGGYPFTNQIDTLCFYYKYAPSGQDTANVSLNFKKNGNQVFQTGRSCQGAVSTYSYAEVWFNTGTPIDTVIVSLQSSNWRDSALSFVGSSFKVDDIHFKSQSMGIKTFGAAATMNVFPNPSSDGSFVVSNVDQHDLVRVLNVFGQEVPATIVKANGEARVQVSTPGAYFVYINSRGRVTTLKVMVDKQ